MITAAILGLLVFVMVGVLSVIPAIGVPDWLSSGDGAISTVFADAGLMSVWFPIQLASAVLLSVVVIWVAGFAVKGARIVISLLTGGGGGAA